MSKRTSLLLGFAAVAVLLSSAAFAAEIPASPVSHEAFLATLQTPGAEAPAEPGLNDLRTEPAPIFMALPSCSTGCCDYSCQTCTATSVKLCAFNHCTGKSGCAACHSGTVCSV